MRLESATRLDSYVDAPLKFTPINIIKDTVTEVGRWLSGGDGPWGADEVSLQNWILHYGESSADLRKIFDFLTEWMAYRALMAACLIGMDKHMGIIPIGIGEMWRRCFAKYVLEVAGPDTKKS